MKIIRRKKDITKLINKINSLSFIPTMGGLHKGHELLIRKAKKKSKVTLVSIFVNPKQFNSKNDFNSYPRNFKKDIKFLKDLNVKYLYYPKYRDIFSFNTKDLVKFEEFKSGVCPLMVYFSCKFS